MPKQPATNPLHPTTLEEFTDAPAPPNDEESSVRGRTAAICWIVKNDLV